MSFEFNPADIITPKIKGMIEGGGLSAVARKFLDMANIEVISSLDPEASDKMHKKLNTEAGLIISNHPGHFDYYAILNLLEREDIKIVVGKTGYKKLAPIIGVDHLIQAKSSMSISEAKEFLKITKDHIENGGVVLLFPTGGKDNVEKENDDLKFESGLGTFLRKVLRPTDMVYSFNIDPKDIRSIVDEKIDRNVGIFTGIATKGLINTNSFKEKKQIHIQESYSQASEWQDIVNATSNEDDNVALAEHFLNQFSK